MQDCPSSGASLVAQLVKNLPGSVGNTGSIPGSGRFPGEVSGNPLHYSCLGNLQAEDPGGLQSIESQRSDMTKYTCKARHLGNYFRLLIQVFTEAEVNSSTLCNA